MTEYGSPVTFRPTTDDAKIISSLKGKLGISLSDLLRLALRRLYDDESQRRTNHVADVKGTRKR